MARGFQIGRLFGTSIYASPGFFLVMVLILLAGGAKNVWAGAVLEVALIVSLLVHEFGHVFAVRWRLGSESRVLLWSLGGLTMHEPTPERKSRILISLMGPAFGFALGGLSWGVLELLPETPGLVHHFLLAMVLINFVWTALNLLPILPLDGGQASLAALEYAVGPARALRTVRYVSVALAAAGVVAAITFGRPVAALMALFLGVHNLTAARFGV